MKREIKFRAWDSDDKTMWYMEKLESDQLPNEVLSVFLDEYYGCDLMQYTGIKDKDGKEIYEGDIVSRPKYNLTYVVVFDEKNAGFELKRIPDKSALTFMELRAFEEKTEVIGNIYQNPELLK